MNGKKKMLLSFMGAAFLILSFFSAGCAAADAVWADEISLSGEETVPLQTEKSTEQVLKIDTDDAKGPAEDTAEKEKREGSLLFAGDIYLSEHVLRAYDGAGGINGVLDDGLRKEIEEADIFMANQEFPFSDRGNPAADKQFTFRLPPSRVSVLGDIGVDIVTLANNHALDYGSDALTDTCRTLDEAGILRVGAGENREEAARAEIMDLNGISVGFVGASRVFPTADWAAGASHIGMLSAYDAEGFLEAVRQARQQCDYLVVYVHWGIERDTVPQTYQRQLAYQAVDAGADMVVGSHPHVLQGIEYYKGKPILYSLGNFVFGGSIPETMLVRASVDEAGETQLTLIPATSSAGYTRELEEDKKAAFYQKIEGLSTGIRIDGTGAVYQEDVDTNQSP